MTMGTFIPNAKQILTLVANVDELVADRIVTDLQNDIPITLKLKSKFKSDDWESFTSHFESYSLQDGALSAPSDYGGEPDDLADTLKLFRVFISISESDGPLRTNSEYRSLVLATDEDEAADSMHDQTPLGTMETIDEIDVEEIEGPFINGQMLMVYKL